MHVGLALGGYQVSEYMWMVSTQAIAILCGYLWNINTMKKLQHLPHLQGKGVSRY